MIKRNGARLFGQVLALGIAGLILTQNGCSIIGLVTGLQHDAKKPKGGAYPGWQWVEITPGTEVTVRLTDGTKVKGTLMSVDQLPTDQYVRNYVERRQSDTAVAALPAIRDSVWLTLMTPEEVSGTFLGFDQWFDSATVVPCVRVWPKGQMSSRCIDLRQVASFRDAHDHTVAIDSITSLARSKRLPLSSALILSTHTGQTDIPFDRIDRLLFHGRYGAVQGFLVGLVIDAAIVGIAAMVVASMFPDCLLCGAEADSSSCPYVYSFDGERYVRDAELFAGSIFRAAQRGDWTRLDHLEESEGRYRLKIANEREETEYMDELSLLAVDHPSGTEVVPTFGGKLCLLSHPESPEAATDLEGCNVLDLVSATDDQVWTSNPFGRNPEDSSQIRDGLVLRFHRPPETDSVTLAFNLQNTAWGAYLQNKIVQMLGTGAQTWYDTLDNSLAAREAFHQAMIREGMLLIRLWDGETWRPADHVWEVGPGVAKDVAVRLGLRDIPGESLCVRLESTAGLWMINSVRASFASTQPVHVTELSLQKARSSDGADLRERLREADSRYYEMPTKLDWAELEFAALPPKPERERSFVLKSSGYYRIHTSAASEPKAELAQRLLTEPGAFGRFALRLLNEQARSAFASAIADSGRQ